MKIIDWLKGMLSSEDKTEESLFIPNAPIPTINIYHPRGCGDYATFLIKNIDKMEAKLHAVDSSSFASGDVSVHITFSIPYLTKKAYEIYGSRGNK